MAKRRFIFFDVGNTLLFPNRARVLTPLPADKHPTLEHWQALERRTKHEFDASMMSGKADFGFWRVFHTNLLNELNALDRKALDNGVRDAIVENMRHSANWDHILPGTIESLDRIRQHYAIAVI